MPHPESVAQGITNGLQALTENPPTLMAPGFRHVVDTMNSVVATVNGLTETGGEISTGVDELIHQRTQVQGGLQGCLHALRDNVGDTPGSGPMWAALFDCVHADERVTTEDTLDALLQVKRHLLSAAAAAHTVLELASRGEAAVSHADNVHSAAADAIREYLGRLAGEGSAV